MTVNNTNIKRLILLIIVLSWLIHLHQFSQVKTHLIDIEKNVDELLLLHLNNEKQNQNQQQQTNNRTTSSNSQQQQNNNRTSSSTLSNLSTATLESSALSPSSSSSSFASSKTKHQEYTVQGEWGEYIVVDPTRVKRSIIQRYYYNENESVSSTTSSSTTAGLLLLSSSSSSSSLSLNSYLPFYSQEEKNMICNTNTTTSYPTTIYNDSIIYNRIQINGPNQGFYQITRTKKTNKAKTSNNNNTTSLLQNHLLRNYYVTDINNNEQQQSDDKKDDPRILCVLYTYHERNHMITAIGETWGWKCDGFIAASTRNILQDDEYQQSGYGSIKLPHKGKESYTNMWQKTRSILQYIYKHYQNQFDFFYICGDDVHMIVENLRNTIVSMGPTAYTQPLFMGQWIPLTKNQSIYKKSSSNIKMLPPKDEDDYFVGGGPGYVLNKVALKILVEELLSNCHTNVKSSTEDMLISDCLKRIGIYGNNSVDLYGRQRFDECPRIQNQILNALETNKLPSFWMNTLKYWSYHFTTSSDNTTTTTITSSDQKDDNDDNDINIIKYYHQPNNRISKQLIAMHGFKTPFELKKHHSRLYNSCV